MIKLKNWFILGLLSLFMISLSSCSDDEDLGSSSDLVGTWKIESSYYSIKVNGQLVDEEENTDIGEVMTFNSDGTIYEDGETAKWSYEDGKIRIEFDNEVEYIPVKVLTSSKLEIEYTEKEKEDEVEYEIYVHIVYKKISD